MTESKPLIIPGLVAFDANAGLGKEDVVKFLAATVADTGRASNLDDLAADVKKRKSTTPTRIPGGIVVPHCRSPHVLAPSLGFARLAQPVDFGAADGQATDLVFMIAAPDSADDFHLQLLAKLACGLIQTEFTDALRQVTDTEGIARIVTKQIRPELLDSGQEAENSEASKAGEAGKAGSATNPVIGVGAMQTEAAATSSAPTEGEAIIMGVSSYLTGIAHTFMAAEALEQADKDRNIAAVIEGQDSGKINALDPGLIKRTSTVIFTHDLPVKGHEHLAGKPVVDIDVKAAANGTGPLVGKALAAVDGPSVARVPAGGEFAEKGEKDSEHRARRLQRSVMIGVSCMIPFVVAGGLPIALGFLLAGYSVASPYEGISISDYSLWNLSGNEFVHEIKNSANNAAAIETIAVSQPGLLLYIGWTLFLLGQAAMSFLIPVLADYISFRLADRPEVTPRFVMGVVAVRVSAGFTSGLVGGILAGYFAAWLARLNVPTWLQGLAPVVVIPLGTTLVVGAVMYLVLGRPLAALMTGLKHGLTSVSEGGSAVLLGIILGLVVCFDLGGSINKATYLFGTAGLSEASASNTAPYRIMAAVMAAGMIPPLAISAATFLRSRLFTKAGVENGRSAWLLGLSFISEGAIPFAATDPLRVIPAIMADGAVTGTTIMAMHVGSHAPHSRMFVASAITHFGGFLLAIPAGTVVSAVLVVTLKGLGRNADGKKGVGAQTAAVA